MVDSMNNLLDDFRAFVAKGRQLMSADRQGGSIELFKVFVSKAVPALISEIGEKIPLLIERRNLIRPWLIEHDLLRIARVTLIENSYTELARWALDHHTHPESSLHRQEAWLKSVNVVVPKEASRKYAEIYTQVVTDDGIPDLILQFPDLVVVVEAKTRSYEHSSPSGLPQTIAYPEAVRQKLSLPQETRVEMVFLTLDGSLPENTGAHSATYAGFVFATASALDLTSLPEDVRWAYRLLFTHLLTCQVSDASNIVGMLDEVAGWEAIDTWGNDLKTTAHRLGTARDALDILFPGEFR